MDHNAPFQLGLQDLNILSDIDIRTANSRYRHLVQNETALQTELDALEKVAMPCYADVPYPEAGVGDSRDAPIARGAPYTNAISALHAMPTCPSIKAAPQAVPVQLRKQAVATSAAGPAFLLDRRIGIVRRLRRLVDETKSDILYQRAISAVDNISTIICTDWEAVGNLKVGFQARGLHIRQGLGIRFRCSCGSSDTR